MTGFDVNTHRRDPYKNFRFRVRWDGRVVCGVSGISGLSRSTEPIELREGEDPNELRIAPGLTRWDPVRLERGITHDDAFQAWADLVHRHGGEPALKDYRKDVTVELLNEQGSVAAAWHVFRCWVSEYRALPEMDADGNAVAIESIVLQNEGWQRDEAVGEPAES